RMPEKHPLTGRDTDTMLSEAEVARLIGVAQVTLTQTWRLRGSTLASKPQVVVVPHPETASWHRYQLLPATAEGVGFFDAVVRTAFGHPEFGVDEGVTALGGMTPDELRDAVVEHLGMALGTGNRTVLTVLSATDLHPQALVALIVDESKPWDDLVTDLVASLVADRFRVRVRHVDGTGRSMDIGPGGRHELVVYREPFEPSGWKYRGTEPLGARRAELEVLVAPVRYRWRKRSRQRI